MVGRDDKNGPNGSGINIGGAFTLNTADRHCVAFKSESYVIRRLTPTECARLQGFPDDWCGNLESDPTDEEIDQWSEIFETNRKLTGGKVKKSRKQIANWLRSPHSDSAEYKMWGNGVALPCVDYVMAGIKYWADKEVHEGQQEISQMTIEQWMKETTSE